MRCQARSLNSQHNFWGAKMAEKPYTWADGAVLEEHSKRKHKILREYFSHYLAVRCQLPQQTRFRIAIMDGFAGGGRYQCGAEGSPLIFVEELALAVEAVNLKRAAEGLRPIEFQCLLVLNDFDAAAIHALKSNMAPVLGAIFESDSKLDLKIEYLNMPFGQAYPKMKELIAVGRFSNVIFNLDQCGYSHVENSILTDIMTTYSSVEIFYTFAIQSLITFLNGSNPNLLASQLGRIGLQTGDIQVLDGTINKKEWLGAAENIVFETFRQCAPFVTPFSINNPSGWRYWFIHFANNYRARQVYNNTLHDNSSSQAHFGRSGLNMLSYDPREDGSLYLFDMQGRDQARVQLLDDIPRVISGSGDAMIVGDFYHNIYNSTPAHTEDIHGAIIENPDIEVITLNGGERRKANTISVTDVLKLKKQASFFHMFDKN